MSGGAIPAWRKWLGELPIQNPASLTSERFYIVDGEVLGIKYPIIHQGTEVWVVADAGENLIWALDETLNEIVGVPKGDNEWASIASAIRSATRLQVAYGSAIHSTYNSVTKASITARLITL